MRLLVTGSAGFIGSDITERVSKDHDVIVRDDPHTGHKKTLMIMIWKLSNVP